LAWRGEHLSASAIVLAGALTDAVPIRPGVVYRAEIDSLGTVGFSTSAP
jgi:2-oxo-3-hexenedioate decarboxylase